MSSDAKLRERRTSCWEGVLSDWWDDEQEQSAPVEVPHTALSAEALRGVVESFVLREGTDYGERDVPHEAKIAQVIRQLERREARIVFDPETQSVHIVLRPGICAPRRSGG